MPLRGGGITSSHRRFDGKKISPQPSSPIDRCSPKSVLFTNPMYLPTFIFRQTQEANMDEPLKKMDRRTFLATSATGLALPFWRKLPALLPADDLSLTPQNTVAWHGRNTAEHK